MSDQPRFDFAEARREREKAIDRVERRVDWMLEVVASLRLFACASRGRPFTSDHLLRYDPSLEKCPEKRVFGAAFRALSREGVIEPTGIYVKSSRITSHARPKREWRAK